jgi:hypothetical protein
VSRAVGRAAARRVAAVQARMIALLTAERGVRVEQTPEGLVVTGRGLRAQWLREAGLRWLGRWA